MDSWGTGIALFMASSAALMQVASGDPMAAVKDYGIAVVVIAWFMWRNEKRLEALTTEIRRLSKILLVSSVEDHDERERMKKRVLDELEDAQ